MSILDPKADAQALESVVGPAEQLLIAAVERLPGELSEALVDAVDGLTITATITATITIKKKGS